LNILIVEDEPKTGDYLQQGLREAGWLVDLATNGHDGLHQALTGDYQLLILDVMLPGLDGWQLLAALRHAGDQGGLQIGACRVNGSAVTGGAGAQNKNFTVC
jgi:two-component system copper resistance phosphate regulon response regulator CusR